MTRRSVLVITVSALALLPATPAAADPLDDAVQALRTTSVYAGAATPTIDRGRLGGSMLDGIKVAVLPTGGPDPVSVARTIGSRLDPQRKGLTVLVFEGHAYGAASSAKCGVGSAIGDAVARHRDELRSSDDVTSTVQAFAQAVHVAPSAADGCPPGGSTAGGTARSSAGGGGGGHPVLVVVLVLVALIVAAVGYAAWSRRRRHQRQLSDARAAVIPYYDRLAADVNGIDPGDNPTARQAMADAAERFTSAGGQLATADSTAKYAQARRTALEGLYAARTARTALGLDPGPALPPVADTAAEQLDRPQHVTVRGETFQGYPAYTPGAPYYFGGAYGIPGGWYAVPFWETLLAGSILAGGLGGWGPGGYGTGFDNGYLTGYEAGEQAADDGNAGGWGDSGGGGDWSSGWGDSGGGGDWGDSGGGGDWGSGDNSSGGGSW